MRIGHGKIHNVVSVRAQKIAQRQPDTEVRGYPRHDARGQKRIAPQVKETVVYADSVQAEHLRPDVAEDLLGGRARWFVGGGLTRALLSCPR